MTTLLLFLSWWSGIDLATGSLETLELLKALARTVGGLLIAVA